MKDVNEIHTSLLDPKVDYPFYIRARRRGETRKYEMWRPEGFWRPIHEIFKVIPSVAYKHEFIPTPQEIHTVGVSSQYPVHSKFVVPSGDIVFGFIRYTKGLPFEVQCYTRTFTDNAKFWLSILSAFVCVDMYVLKQKDAASFLTVLEY